LFLLLLLLLLQTVGLGPAAFFALISLVADPVILSLDLRLRFL
jgi:fumarate reductase subunit C